MMCLKAENKTMLSKLFNVYYKNEVFILLLGTCVFKYTT